DRQADLALPRGLRRPRARRARRLPDRVPLRRRLARDERGRVAEPAPPGHRRPAPPRAVRADRQRRPARLYPRGARVECGRDQPLRAARVPLPGRPARLLHGQPRGRADHVARPGGDARVRRAALVAAAAALLFAAGDGAALGLPGAPALAFPTASAGFAAGGGGILATTDGGRSWHLETPSPAAALSVVDSRPGWAISGRALLRTRDGRTWARIGRPALARIDFVDRRHGFALDRAGRLRRSAEAGRNWRVVRAPARLQALCFVSPRTGWVARGGSVWRTVNAGASWHRWTLVPV